MKSKAPPQPSRSEASGQLKADFGLRRAQFYCLRLALSHYENFFVLGPLTPPRLVPHLAALYAFCRRSDDLADEGPQNAPDRAAAGQHLDDWEAELRRGLGFEGKASHPIIRSIAYTADRFNLPTQPLFDLISAFRQDLSVNRYQTFSDLRDYTRRSADPVGRLVLRLYGHHDPELDALSDSICTGLQLANFCQDVGNDAERERIYIPLDELRQFDVDPVQILDRKPSPALEKLLHFQIVRAYKHLQAGSALPVKLAGKSRKSVQLFILGGLKILDNLQRNPLAALRGRVKLKPGQKLEMLRAAMKSG